MIKSGIISTSGYLMTGSGVSFRNFFCEEWKIVTDAEMPVENFHSHERWSAFAMRGGEILAVIPGCRVDGFIACDSCPENTEAFMDQNGNYSSTKRGLFDLTENKAKGL